MLVYDITNEKSFDNIKNWIRNIEEVNYFTLMNVSRCVCLPLPVVVFTYYLRVFVFHLLQRTKSIHNSKQTLMNFLCSCCQPSLHSTLQQMWKGWSSGTNVMSMTSDRCPKTEERR